MNIRCNRCHMPLSLKRDTVLAALDEVHAENLSHFNFNCPSCRRMNRISKKQLRRAAPGWKPGQAKKEEKADKKEKVEKVEKKAKAKKEEKVEKEEEAEEKKED